MAARPTCYRLAYLTANDGRDFSIDYLNFRNMARRPPGVEHVEITIAISRVRPVSRANLRQIDALVRLAEASPWLSVRTVIWKGNVGRDFSSAQACLQSMAEVAASTDYVMLRNRSAYGPLCDDWYSAYVAQYEKHPDTGLVGSTISLVGPPWHATTDDVRHVQTYVYLSQWRHLAPLIDEFPGCRCKDNPTAIVQGELGLNQQIMAAGLGISCLHWPEHVFRTGSLDDPSLPRRDIKSELSGLPFLYKFPAYRRSRGPFWRRLAWVSSLAIGGLVHSPRRDSQSAEPGVRYLKLSDPD